MKKQLETVSLTDPKTAAYDKMKVQTKP